MAILASIRFVPLTPQSSIQLGETSAEKSIVLPNVPIDKPVIEPPEEVHEEAKEERERVPIPA